tara:strand:- start:454 stop:690 length:237 start_codon:yes stop_codon:yes gene_type:complete
MGRKRTDRGGYYADRKENKANAKLEKTEMKIRLAQAKATKRKWLAAILVLGIIIYVIVSSGSGMSVLNTIKGFLPTGD